MSTCPNKNLEEWKELVDAVGEVEAYRDYLETKGEIRNPLIVQDKILSKKIVPTSEFSKPEFLSGLDVKVAEHFESLFDGTIETERELEIVANLMKRTEQDDFLASMDLAKQMSEALNVPFNLITKTQAKIITDRIGKKYDGGSSFFTNGEVYFVEGSINLNTVFHEFSHPFVRHISVANNKLFNTLYSDLAKTVEGQKIINDIKENYDLEEGSDLFKEEAIVKALERSAGLANINSSKGFLGFIDKMLYAIKKLIRNSFGVKQSLKDLSALTTLEELSEILKSSDKIELDDTYITQKDIISFNKKAKEISEDLKGLNPVEVHELLSKHREITSSINFKTKGKDDYLEINELLEDSFNSNQIDELSKLLNIFKDDISSDVAKMSEDNLSSRKIALVNSMIELETIFKKLYNNAKELYESRPSDENMKRVYQYEQIFSEYKPFIDALNVSMGVDSNVNSSSKIKVIATSLSEHLIAMTNIRNESAKTNSVDVLTQQLIPVNNTIKERYDTMIDELITLGAPKEEIERKHREFYGLSRDDKKIYDNLKTKKNKTIAQTQEFDLLVKESATGLEIDDVKIQMMLNGQLGDMNMFSAFFEGAMTSPDIIVGGLAAYVKSAMAKYEAKVQAYGNRYATDVSELIRNAGMDGENPGEVGEKLGFYDTIATKDENGDTISKRVRTLRNMFQNYRFDYKVKKNNIKELKDAYQDTGSDKDKKALSEAEYEFSKFKYTFFNQKYKSQYYEAEHILMSTELGREAKAELDANSEMLKQITANNVGDPKEENIQKKRILLERRFLGLPFTVDGKKKTGNEKIKSELLKNFTSEKYKYGKRERIDRAFEKALNEHEEFLSQNFDVESTEYKRLRTEWIEENTNSALTDEHQTRVNNLRADLTNLYALRSKDSRNEDVQDLFSDINNEIYALMNEYKDNNGQVDVASMPQERIDRIRQLEKDLVNVKELNPGINGLNKADNARFKELHQINRDAKMGVAGALWNTTLSKELNELSKNVVKKDVELATKISMKQAELASLVENVSSDEYVAIVNQLTTLIKYPKIFDSLKELTPKNSNAFLENRTLINHLRESSEEFKTWFDDNHTEVEYYDKEIKDDVKKWVRGRIWNVNVPKDSSSYQVYELKDEQGGHIEYLKGVPSSRFSEFVVDKQWHTDEIVGKTVDNKGDWLPLARSKDNSKDWDDRYINKEYEEMKARNGDDYALLKFLQNEAINIQKDADYSDKLYYDFPRLLKKGIQEYKTFETNDKGENVNYLTLKIQGMKEFWTGGSTDSMERDLNYDPKQNLRELTKLESIGSSIPLQGLFNIDAERVSNDIAHSQLTYMASLEKKAGLTEISPTVYAIRDLVKKPLQSNTIDNKGNLQKVYSAFKNLTDDNSRYMAIDAFVKVNFEGKKTKEGINSDKIFNNIIGLSSSISSWSFFAFNIPSAIKNVYGAKFQTMIEASGGEFFNHRHAQEGNMFAYGAVGDIMFGDSTLHGGEKPFALQLLDVFDATSQGSFIQDLGKNIALSRSAQLADGTMATSFRKISEKQATMQVFGSMMAAKMVERIDENGDKTSIKYIEAWEIKDGKIQLKEGVDSKHGISYDSNGEMVVGDDFISYRNTIHQVMVKLQGNYADFDQPAAQRYIAFRAISFLRRYFIPMAVERFGYSGKLSDPRARLNVGLGTATKGTYIVFGQMIARMMKGYNRKVNYMTMEEKIATKKVIAEFAMLFIVSSMIALLGYDDDDPERNKKLRQLSGALQIPFLTEKGDNESDFNLGGFAQQHLTLALLNIKAENKQFAPLPGYGLNAYFEMLKPQSISVGPFIGTLVSTIDQLVGTVRGDEASYYKRDMGPYSWQKQEDAKIFNTMFKPFGLTGGAINPSKSVETVQKFSRR